MLTACQVEYVIMAKKKEPPLRLCYLVLLVSFPFFLCFVFIILISVFFITSPCNITNRRGCMKQITLLKIVFAIIRLPYN